jgi:hypothetical protein
MQREQVSNRSDGRDSAVASACVFCGDPRETDEHVIPKWLLRHFNLFDERVLLWNETTIPYRQVVVPACLRCNRDRFAPLEQRIQQGTGTSRDYYLWGLKIMLGLSHRDASLPADRANPGAGPLLPLHVADDLGDISRAAFRSLDSPTFRFTPDPFGSVIEIAASQSAFMLIEVPRPYRAIAISLPNQRYVVIFPGDRGVVASIYRRAALRKRLALELPNVPGQLQLSMAIFGMLILRSHLLIPREVIIEQDALTAAQIPRNLPTCYQPPDVYRGIAGTLRLPTDVADAAHTRYARAYASAGKVRWR